MFNYLLILNRTFKNLFLLSPNLVHSIHRGLDKGANRIDTNLEIGRRHVGRVTHQEGN